MPGVGGVEAITRLAESGVPARVLVSTTYDSDSEVVAAIHAGATGYLLKDAPKAELVRAVRSAARGETVLSPAVATRLVGQVREPLDRSSSDVSWRPGPSWRAAPHNRAAGAELFISEATVKTHLLHIFAMLGVNDRAAAVAAGYERGLVTQRSP